MRPTLARRVALALSASFLTLPFVACCCPPIPVGNGPAAQTKVVADGGKPDVAKGPGGPPPVQLMDPGPPPPEEGAVPSLVVRGAKGAAAYDRYPEPWRGQFVKAYEERVAGARRDLETTAAKYKDDLEKAEKELKAEKAHIQKMKELGVTVDRSKQVAAATDRVAQLKQVREEDVTRPLVERLEAFEVNDPPFFRSATEKQDAEFAALPAAEQERRKELRRRMAEWVAKKREADEHNRTVEEAGKSADVAARPKPATATPPAAPMPAEIPAVFTYAVINERTFLTYKREVYVRISRRVPEDILRALAVKLRDAGAGRYDRTFILYFLPGVAVDGSPWASTHFNPDLELTILGTTVEEQERLDKVAAAATGADVIGKWQDNETAIPGVIVFTKEGGKLFFTKTYKDGSRERAELTSKKVGNQVRYGKVNDRFGDYFVIDAKGNLGYGDAEEGIWATSMKAK